MKKLIYLSLIVFVIVLSFSCERSFDKEIKYDDNALAPKAVLQTYIATVGASRNMVFVDGARLYGASMSLGSVLPGTGPGAQLYPGVRNILIKDTLPTSTQVPISFSQNFEYGKVYALFLYDTTTSPKYKIVETPIVIPSDTSARVRLANFFYSKTPIPSIDVFSQLQQKNVLSNVASGQVTEFINLPSLVQDTFYIRESGTQTTKFGYVITGGFTPKQSYTIFFRGNYSTATGTNPSIASLIRNY